MSENIDKIPCNQCGWCCQRTPCSLGVYMGAAIKGSCRFLTETVDQKFICGLVEREISEIKKLAVKELILSGDGCSHKYGPHPVSLLKMLLEKGLKVGSFEWVFAKNETVKEFERFTLESADPKSLVLAIEEFKDFVEKMESI